MYIYRYIDIYIYIIGYYFNLRDRQWAGIITAY